MSYKYSKEDSPPPSNTAKTIKPNTVQNVTQQAKQRLANVRNRFASRPAQTQQPRTVPQPQSSPVQVHVHTGHSQPQQAPQPQQQPQQAAQQPNRFQRAVASAKANPQFQQARAGTKQVYNAAKEAAMKAYQAAMARGKEMMSNARNSQIYKNASGKVQQMRQSVKTNPTVQKVSKTVQDKVSSLKDKARADKAAATREEEEATSEEQKSTPKKDIKK